MKVENFYLDVKQTVIHLSKHFLSLFPNKLFLLRTDPAYVDDGTFAKSFIIVWWDLSYTFLYCDER